MWPVMISRAELIAELQSAGISAKKSLGQNFLVEPAVLGQIVEVAELGAEDHVLEIGPGLGFLTQYLLSKTSNVVAIEADARLVGLLQHKYPQAQIVHGDFLQTELPADKSYKVVANLPYYITSAIFKKLHTAKNKPRNITALVQKEVAERICAPVGKLSVLALSVGYYGEARYIATVPATSFVPAPKVDSAIIRIDVYDQPVFVADEKQLFRLIKAGFGERRKQLRNALSGGLQLPPDTVAGILDKADIASTARAQELGLADWQRLYGAWQEHNG